MNRSVDNTLDTINAAATAIAAAAGNRPPHVSIQKRRWGSCWSLYWCFGSQKHRKRIGHAVLVPETTASGADAPAAENPPQPPAIALPFVAPPSSPASFLQSEPPSSTQSPAALPSLTAISANIYSPGPRSIFAIGPYAHETQLVSPPVFSTFTTEPSTAPLTPPPESVHLTTPSSPEVPFARLLDPSHQNGESGQRFSLFPCEFPSYQLYPGSPVGQLISPSSGISGSGTSSPFPDPEFVAGGSHSLEFRTGDPPKLLNLDLLSSYKWGSRQGSGLSTPDAVVANSPCDLHPDQQKSEVPSPATLENGGPYDDTITDPRVSFELTAENTVRCMEKRASLLTRAVSVSLRHAATAEKDANLVNRENSHECHACKMAENEQKNAYVNGEESQQHQKHRSITLGSSKDFNFNNTDGGENLGIGSEWWANERVRGKEDGSSKNWSFFPMLQPGVS
ncbi:hypothetical protein RJ641_035561 [Dillenia turbinata]|uniref:Hydroxyproline-rich glycoprotein family protein n=1 Tax=Dillenia turbinata TaxID=194707 RepID=A0AAN8VST3_9MAGN